MNQFKNVDDLSKAFLGEDFIADTELRLGADLFTLTHQSNPAITKTLSKEMRPIAVYTSESVATQVILFWNGKGGSVVPGGVVVTDKPVGGAYSDQPDQENQDVVLEMNGEKITIRPDQLIGDIVNVKFTSFNSPRELKGKVDTGATISSLHADNYKINGNTVTFTCAPLGPNSVTVPLKTQHAVKSPDGGTHYRPVIELNVKVNGKLLNNVLFNLNDRGNMDQPVLLGQNLLQAGKFFVDPTRNEVAFLDFSEIEKLIEDLKPVDDTTNPVHEIYQKMLDSNISFRDLVRHIRGEVIKTDLEG